MKAVLTVIIISMFLVFGHTTGIFNLSSSANGSVGCTEVPGANMSIQNVCPSASSSSCSSSQITTPTSSSRSSQDNGNNASTSANGLLNYQNSTFGISICYPFNWKVISGTTNGTLTNVATFLLPGSSVFGQLSVNDLHSQNVNLIGYLNYIINSYRIQAADFKLVGSNMSNSLADKPAYVIVYTYNDRVLGMLKILETGSMIGQKLYLFRYIVAPISYSLYLPIAKEMTASLEITPSQTGKAPNELPGGITNSTGTATK